jgi:glycerophosphoryl diester phosphodiesterase
VSKPERRPAVIAHRGASGYRPEHSRSAYLLAIEQGADAVEPDLVSTRDGVLVIRHENEISGTTDVASRPEFASRRTTKTIEGISLTGWFTEDFSWAELSTRRTRERLPKLRKANRAFEGEDGILRLSDLLELLDAAPAVGDGDAVGDGLGDDGAAGGAGGGGLAGGGAAMSSVGGDGVAGSTAAGRRVGLVAEIKHASYFESIGLPLDELFAAELVRAGWAGAAAGVDGDARLTVESFETGVLGKIRARGIRARYVFLLEATGAPADHPERPYADYLTPEGLAELAGAPGQRGGLGLDGISVPKQLLLRTDDAGRTSGVTDLVERAHAAGLTIFCWTLRAENRFLPADLRLGLSPAAFGNWRHEFGLLLGSGLDGVFADQPDLALEVRAGL